MLFDELKKRMFEAMKRKDTVQKEVLRTAIGDITSTGQEPDDARVIGVLKKLVKSIEETMAVAGDEAKLTLQQELVVLQEFLPRTLSVEQIVEALAPVADQVRAADNDGKATGVAMKHLKSTSAEVEGKDVSQAVKQLRSA